MTIRIVRGTQKGKVTALQELTVSWGVNHKHKANPNQIVIIATMEKKNHTSISACGKEINSQRQCLFRSWFKK